MTEAEAFRSPEQLLPDDAHDDLRRFVGYWISKANGRPMPTFEEIDPIEIPWALSRLYLVRASDDGEDFTYRLVGETIKDRHRTALVGKRPGDLFAAPLADRIVANWRNLIREPAACYTLTEHPTKSGALMRAQRVMLPLGPAEGIADHILGMTVFETPLGATGAIDWAGPLAVRWLPLRKPA